MKILLAGIASTLLMSSAYAASGGQSAANPPASMHSDAQRNAAVEKHIKELHAQLGITSAEESQWAEVAHTMRDSATELDRAIDKRAATAGNATAIDDLNSYGDVAQAHLDSVKKLAAVFAPLYAAMSNDQKKVADEVFGQRHEEKKVAQIKN